MKIILASNSPRRKELLAGLGFDYEVRTLQGLDESYPDGLPMEEIPQYISRKKAAAYSVGEDDCSSQPIPLSGSMAKSWVSQPMKKKPGRCSASSPDGRIRS